jgi:iron complex transport system permease protein
MGATRIILTLARIRQLSAEAIILAGAALSSLFASATILVQYLATETELAVVVFWTFGEVARSNWRDTGLAGAVSLMTMVYLLIRRWDLNALTTGEEAARGRHHLHLSPGRPGLRSDASGVGPHRRAGGFCG